MDVVFALLTSLGHALDYLCIRKGLAQTPAPVAATFITLSVNFIFFIILSIIFVPGHLFKLDLIYLFVIAGMLAPAFARALIYKSIETLGLSLSLPIASTDSFFAVTVALIFFGERLTFSLATGIISVLTGIALLGYETGRDQTSNVSLKIKYRYLFYPLLAACLFGVSVSLRKLGLGVVNSPLLGATVTSGTSWCVITLFMMARGQLKGVFQVKKRSLVYFFIGGTMNCIAWLALFQALSIGRVSIVSPLAGCCSLFSLLLNVIFLRETERINVKIVFGTLLVVGGAVTLSLAR
ncbi:MAG: EamA family transporter [Deltaproteobacteria bacterium]